MEKDYQVVTCASFGNTGSGVVTDYLLEFDEVYSPGDYEFRFMQDYGGISTLEDGLVTNAHRTNSDIAIRDFLRIVNYQSGDIFSKRYEKFFHGAFKDASYRFIDKLTEVSWPGYHEHHQIITTPLRRAWLYKIYPRILRMLQGNRKYIAGYVPRSTMYFANPSREYFYQCVQEYMDELCIAVDKDHRHKFIYFDQLLPPTSIERYFNYCRNLKVVVVDRDPRDHYIDNCNYWHEGWIPMDLDQYITLYRGIRKKLDEEVENPNVLRIRFEDAIFHYDTFKEKINTFLGLTSTDHTRPCQYFDPAKSIRNTRLWNRYPTDQSILDKIVRELPEFCYDFNQQACK